MLSVGDHFLSFAVVLAFVTRWVETPGDASVYFSDWVLNVKEDEIVFFPSFLKHRVASTLDPNYPRITSAGNISVVTNNYV